MADVAQLGQPLFFVAFDLALTALALGRYDDAFAAARRSVELADRVGDQGFWWCRAKNTLGGSSSRLCDTKQGARHNQEAVDRALVFGDKETLRNAQLNLGDCALGTAIRTRRCASSKRSRPTARRTRTRANG